jgi:ubiquinone/menaquinone biosynthesis C-methylase UbiE
MNDGAYVREQYRYTEKLETRISIWQPHAEGQSPQDLALQALGEVQPREVLEVGAGTGAFSIRCANELLCHVIAVDSSDVMVSASMKLGVEAVFGDVQDLKFPDSSFDAAVAAWMLYHVADLDMALSELARVIRPGGRLVAITNGRDHLSDLWDMAGVVHPEPSFSRENGCWWLSKHFASVTQRDIASQALFPQREAASSYLQSIGYADAAERLPQFDEPFIAWGTPTVFIADK